MSNFNGCDTLWFKDYGVPKILEDYEVLKSYPPLHNIDEDKQYSPMLIMTAADNRVVHPAHSLKFVATMQDRIEKESCYLYWKDNGDHGDVFKKDWNTDYDAYADMLLFIEKALNL